MLLYVNILKYLNKKIILMGIESSRTNVTLNMKNKVSVIKIYWMEFIANQALLKKRSLNL